MLSAHRTGPIQCIEPFSMVFQFYPHPQPSPNFHTTAAKLCYNFVLCSFLGQCRRRRPRKHQRILYRGTSEEVCNFSTVVFAHCAQALFLTDEEISAAFEFFDAKGTGELNPQDLRERMGMFIPSLSMRECKLLVSSEGSFTKDKLRSLLQDNEVTNFDPIAEAFKVCVV